MRKVIRIATMAAILAIFGGGYGSSVLAQDNKPPEKSSAAREAGETAREAWESGKGAARDAWDTGKDTARKAWQSTRDFFRGAWNSGKETAKEAGRDVKDGWNEPEKRR